MLLDIIGRLHGGAARVPVSTYISVCAVAVLTLAVVIASRVARLHSIRRHLKSGGLKCVNLTKSNMRDQFEVKYALPEDAEANGNARIKALYVHPVKSCGAVEVRRALLTKTGFLYDRCFTLAAETPDPDDKNKLHWRFISQRKMPQMSQIRTELWLPKADETKAGGSLILSFDDPNGRDQGWVDRLATMIYERNSSAVPEISFAVPLEAPKIPKSELKYFAIHGRQASGVDMTCVSSIAAAMSPLKIFLGIPKERDLKLLRCTDDTLVRTDRNLAPLKYIGTPAVHGYTDQQPVNINSLSSVHAVSTLLPPENQPLDALRFRANIWTTNTPAYDEESWKRYQILPKSHMSSPSNDVVPLFSVVCRTSRCTMPNVNLQTGEFDTDIPVAGKKRGYPQPSTTLVEKRTIETGNKAALGYLGMHCVPEDSALDQASRKGHSLFVEVGDEIEVLERGEHLYGSTANDY